LTVLLVPDDGEALWPSLGGQVCDWIEANLCFGPGDLRGQPAKLDDEKRALIWRMYEVYPRSHEWAGRRRFKRAGISLPKGLAKTELAAWIAAAELHPGAPVRTVAWDGDTPIGGPVTDPYIALVAYTEEQSDELAYGALKAILEESEVREDFDIGLERIMRAGGDGKAVSLASAPSARDGARTSFAICDETHWWTLPRLVRAHQTMLANIPKRKLADAWTLEITTAPEPGTGSVAEATMEYARQVASGKLKDDRLLFFHRQASDKHDLATEEGARAAVIEASGPAAAWRDIDSIVQLWRDPTTDRSYWERVYCNRLVQATRQAFDATAWKALARADSPVKDGDLITIGFDGALTFDSTGIVCTHVETGYQWPAGLWERPYNVDEWMVPKQEVDETMRALFERYEVFRLYADPPYWENQIDAWTGEFGEERVIKWWTNRRSQMAHALLAFHTAIAQKTLSHSGDKDLDRHVANARKQDLPQRDEHGAKLWLIRKERPDSPFKIDLAMAAVLSWEARNDAIASGAAGGKSFWEVA
jgi:phage terminase large subunit-like protein